MHAIQIAAEGPKDLDSILENFRCPMFLKNILEIAKEIKNDSEFHREQMEKMKEGKEDPQQLKDFYMRLISRILFGSVEVDKELLENHSKLREELSPKISEVTGFKTTPTPDIIAYQSGNAMMKDALLNIVEGFDIFKGLSDKMRAASKKDSDAKKDKKARRLQSIGMLARMPILVPKLIYAVQKIRYLSHRAMGIADVAQFSPQNIILPYDSIGIATDNIANAAKTGPYDIENLMKYIICHEYIHVFQMANTKSAQLRKDLAADMTEGLFDRKSKRQEIIMERVNCLMTAIEGHAEFFSNLVHDKYYEFRFSRRKPSLRARIESIYFGFDKQIQRYIEGEKMIKHLYKKGGPALAHMPLSFPPESMNEITDPENYLKRIGI